MKVYRTTVELTGVAVAAVGAFLLVVRLGANPPIWIGKWRSSLSTASTTLLVLGVIAVLTPHLAAKLAKKASGAVIDDDILHILEDVQIPDPMHMIKLQFGLLVVAALPVVLLLTGTPWAVTSMTSVGSPLSLRRLAHSIALYEPTTTAFTAWQRHPWAGPVCTFPHSGLPALVSLLEAGRDGIESKVAEASAEAAGVAGPSLVEETLGITTRPLPHSRQDVAVAATLIGRVLTLSSEEGGIPRSLGQARSFFDYALSLDPDQPVALNGLGVCNVNEIKAVPRTRGSNAVSNAEMELAGRARTHFQKARRLSKNSTLTARCENNMTDLELHMMRRRVETGRPFRLASAGPGESAWVSKLNRDDYVDSCLVRSRALADQNASEAELQVTYAQALLLRASISLRSLEVCADSCSVDHAEAHAALQAACDAMSRDVVRPFFSQIRRDIEDDSTRFLLFSDAFDRCPFGRAELSRLIAFLDGATAKH